MRPSRSGTWVKFVNSLPFVVTPTVNTGMPCEISWFVICVRPSLFVRLDREAVDLVGVGERLDLLDLLLQVARSARDGPISLKLMSPP